MRGGCLRLRLEEVCRVCKDVQHACATLSATGGGGFSGFAHSARPCLNICSKWAQDLPEMGPKWFTVAPRWPNMAQDGPKMAQDSANMAHDSPKLARDGPKIAQEGSKIAPRWLQIGPRRPEDGLKTAQYGPKMDQDSPKMVPIGRRWPKMQPISAQTSTCTQIC